jgi:hypothetical protein
VNGTSKTRIERVDGTQNFQWLLRIGHGIAEQRSFIGSMCAVFIAGTGVPGGRNDGLIVGNLAVLNHDPMLKLSEQQRRGVRAKRRSWAWAD